MKKEKSVPRALRHVIRVCSNLEQWIRELLYGLASDLVHKVVRPDCRMTVEEVYAALERFNRDCEQKLSALSPSSASTAAVMVNHPVSHAESTGSGTPSSEEWSPRSPAFRQPSSPSLDSLSPEALPLSVEVTDVRDVLQRLEEVEPLAFDALQQPDRRAERLAALRYIHHARLHGHRCSLVEPLHVFASAMHSGPELQPQHVFVGELRRCCVTRSQLLRHLSAELAGELREEARRLTAGSMQEANRHVLVWRRTRLGEAKSFAETHGYLRLAHVPPDSLHLVLSRVSFRKRRRSQESDEDGSGDGDDDDRNADGRRDHSPHDDGPDTSLWTTPLPASDTDLTFSSSFDGFPYLSDMARLYEVVAAAGPSSRLSSTAPVDQCPFAEGCDYQPLPEAECVEELTSLLRAASAGRGAAAVEPHSAEVGMRGIQQQQQQQHQRLLHVHDDYKQEEEEEEDAVSRLSGILELMQSSAPSPVDCARACASLTVLCARHGRAEQEMAQEAGLVKLTLWAIRLHPDTAPVFSKATQALAQLCSGLMSAKKAFLVQGGVDLVTDRMSALRASAESQVAACSLVKQLLWQAVGDNADADEKAEEVSGFIRQSFVSAKLVEALLAAMREHEGLEDVVASCCSCLWFLLAAGSVQEKADNRYYIISSGGVHALVRAMQALPQSAVVQAEAADAVDRLVYGVASYEEMFAQVGGVAALIRALNTHAESPAVEALASCVKALRRLCIDNEFVQQQLLLASGLSAVLLLLHVQRSEEAIQVELGGLLELLLHADVQQVKDDTMSDRTLRDIVAAMGVHLETEAVQDHYMGVLGYLCTGEHDDLNQAVIAEAGGGEAVLRGMQAHRDVVRVQRSGCLTLNVLCLGDVMVSRRLVGAGVVDDLVAALNVHAQEDGVCYAACKAFVGVCRHEDAEITATCVASGAVELILGILDNHKSEANVVTAACLAACCILWDAASEVQHRACGAGWVIALMEAMRLHEQDTEIATTCLCMLLTMGSNEQCGPTVFGFPGFVAAVVRPLRLHGSVEDVAFPGCCVLAALCEAHEGAGEGVVSAGGVEAVIDAMDEQLAVNLVQAAACWALTNICRTQATAVLHAGGVGRVLQAMELHADDEDVQQWGCAALCNLCSDGGAAAVSAILAAGGEEAVSRAVSLHPQNESVLDAARQAAAAAQRIPRQQDGGDGAGMLSDLISASYLPRDRAALTLAVQRSHAIVSAAFRSQLSVC